MYNYTSSTILAISFPLEWFLGLWANCPNVGSLVSLGLFECENKSKSKILKEKDV